MRKLFGNKIFKVALIVFLVLFSSVIYLLYRYNYIPHRKYTDSDFRVQAVKSFSDADRDGIEDYEDILKSAQEYISTKPKYKSKYYDKNGYPDDGFGVCSDVVGFALQGAGYDLKQLVADDIRERAGKYDIEEPDDNIDFRRVKNLKVFFDNWAYSLTTDVGDYGNWQAGDIVVWSKHIGVISDKRNSKGIPFVIHNANPIQASYEEDILGSYGKIVGHYRLKDYEKEAIDAFEHNDKNDKVDKAIEPIWSMD